MMRFFRSASRSASRSTRLLPGLILVAAVASSGCDFAKRVIGKDKLNQGALLYNQGRVEEAKQYFKSATEYMPDAPVAWLYYGATLVKDYKNETGEKREQAAQVALDVYKKALDLAQNDCKTRDNASAYIASIYDDLGKNDEWRDWMLKRADLECATKATKATTNYSIAVKYWQCAYDQTTRYSNKAQAADPFHYRDMEYSDAARADKKKVEDCVAKGLEYIEKSLAVDPEYAEAMFYKGLLYREKQKMAKAEPDRKQFEAEAKRIAEEATALTKRKEAEKEQQQQQATPSPH